MKLSKRYRLVVGITAIAIISLYCFKNYARSCKNEYGIITAVSTKIFDFNILKVNLDSSLTNRSILIVNNNINKTIYKNGKVSSGISNNYGHRVFSVFMDDQKIYEFGHFSKNNWYTFDYVLDIIENESSIEIDVCIKGSGTPYDDFFYKKFEYGPNGNLDKVVYLSKEKKIYSIDSLIE